MPVGLPLVETLAPGRSSFFTYTLPDALSTVSFSLSSYVGAPGLYLSSSANSTRPRGDTAASFCQSSAPLAADGSVSNGASYGVVTFAPGGAAGACRCDAYPCTLYLGVGSDDFSYFALAASEGRAGGAGGILSLFDSVPLRSEWKAVSGAGGGGAPGARTQLFDFTFIPSAVSAALPSIVNVELTQVGGDAGTVLYARWLLPCSAPPCARDAATVTNATAAYTAALVSGAASLTVPRADGAFLGACNSAASNMPCTLRLAVTSAAGAQGYVLTARTDGGAQLLDGLPAMGNVASQGGAAGRPTVFFRFAHTTPLAALVFTLTPVNGPVDFYLCSSSTAGCQAPTAGSNATWAVVSTSPNLNAPPATVTVLPTDAGACAPPCAYYLGVRTSAAVTEGTISFSVLARTRGAATGALIDGRAVFDSVEAGGAATFSVFFPASSPSLLLSLTPLAGEVTLGVAVAGAPPVAPAPAPVTLGPLSAARAERTLLLTRDLPLISAGCSTAVRTRDWECIDVGMIDPLCSWGPWYWVLGAPAACTITVTVTGDGGRVSAAPAAAAAAGGGGVSSFALAAWLRSGPLLLRDGVTSTLLLTPAASTLYAFEAAAGSTHVKLVLTQLYGRARGFVSTAAGAPTAATAQWTFGALDSDVLTLDLANAAACAPTAPRCTYYIAMAPWTASPNAGDGALATAQVRLQASSMTVVAVEQGAPTAGRAGPGGFQYYAYTVRAEDVANGGVDVLVETTRGSGWALLLAGADAGAGGAAALPAAVCPDAATAPAACEAPLLVFTAASTRGLGAKARLALRAGATRGFAAGATFIIGVTTVGDTEFALIVRPGGLPVPLPNGLLLHDRVASRAEGAALYAVSLPAGARPAPLLLEGTALAGYPQFWVAAAPPGGAPVNASNAPGPATSDAMFDAASGYQAALDAPFVARACPALATADCVIYVAVRPAPFTPFPVEFTLSASLTNVAAGRASLLTAGTPVLGTATAGGWNYFLAPLAAGRGNATITLNDVVGRSALFVNPGGLVPVNASLGALLRADARANPKVLRYSPATVGPLFAAPTMLAIGVWTDSPFSQFFISFTTPDAVVALPDGAPIQASAEAGEVAYFSLDVPAGATARATINRFSGASSVFGGKWYDDGEALTAAGNPATFRFPSAAAAPLRGDMEGVLTAAPGAPGGCAPGVDCTLLLGVSCAGSIPCVFTISAAATPLSLTRLSDSVPQVGTVAEGAYAYFVYNALPAGRNFRLHVQALTGAVALAVSASWLPGASDPAALPAFGAAGSFNWSTAAGARELVIAGGGGGGGGGGAGARSPTSSFAASGLSAPFVVAVYGADGTTNFALMARQAGGATTLQPGMPSFTRTLLPGGSDLYVFDNQDLANDLVIEAVLMYGAITVSASTAFGVWPTCTYAPPAPNATTGAPAPADRAGTAACPTAMWRADSTGMSMLMLRVSPRGPCSPAATPAAVAPGPCSPLFSWVAGPINIVVTATLPVEYKLSVTTGADAIRASDGERTILTQPVDAAPQVIRFATDPDETLSEVFLTLGSDSFAPSFNYYLSSCVSWACSPAATAPRNGSAQLVGAADAGAQVSITITRGKPGFCDGSSLRNETCYYFLTVMPIRAYCDSARISPCTATVTVTFFSATGSAAMVVPYADLRQRFFLMSGLPLLADYRGLTARPKRFELYVNRVGAPDWDTVDLTLRIDACDSLRGHAVAFACVSTPLGRFPDCANPARPSNDSAQFVLNTRATGSASIALPAEPSNMLYVSVASEPFRDAGRAVASDAALARSVPPGSSYELSISDGAPLVIKAAPAMAATRISQSEVNITWQPPTAFAGALNASAVGLRYVAYYAHNLTDFAMRATGMSAADLGILPTTVCGLERWAALVAANFTPPVFAPGAPLVLNIKKLKPGVRYRVNMVAQCDDNCQVANYLQLGLPLPTGALSTQRIMFPLFYFVLDADPPAHLEVPLSSGVFVVGVLATLGAAAGALVMGFKRGATEEQAGTKVGAVAAAGADAKSVSKGPGGRPIVASLNNYFFASRQRSAEAAAASAALGAAAPAGGRAVATQQAAELEDLARVATVVFSPKKGAEE
jgi:hypothetical protein